MNKIRVIGYFFITYFRLSFARLRNCALSVSVFIISNFYNAYTLVSHVQYVPTFSISTCTNQYMYEYEYMYIV